MSDNNIGNQIMKMLFPDGKTFDMEGYKALGEAFKASKEGLDQRINQPLTSRDEMLDDHIEHYERVEGIEQLRSERRMREGDSFTEQGIRSFAGKGGALADATNQIMNPLYAHQRAMQQGDSDDYGRTLEFKASEGDKNRALRAQALRNANNLAMTDRIGKGLIAAFTLLS